MFQSRLGREESSNLQHTMENHFKEMKNKVKELPLEGDHACKVLESLFLVEFDGSCCEQHGYAACGVCMKGGFVFLRWNEPSDRDTLG